MDMAFIFIKDSQLLCLKLYESKLINKGELRFIMSSLENVEFLNKSDYCGLHYRTIVPKNCDMLVGYKVFQEIFPEMVVLTDYTIEIRDINMVMEELYFMYHDDHKNNILWRRRENDQKRSSEF